MSPARSEAVRRFNYPLEHGTQTLQTPAIRAPDILILFAEKPRMFLIQLDRFYVSEKNLFISRLAINFLTCPKK